MISVTLQTRHKKVALALSLATAMFSTTGAQAMAADNANVDLDPEVESNVWEENDQECASVTLNGKELITYRGETPAGSAEDRAENLADKLQDLLKGEKLDPSKLVPACEGQLATIRVDGASVVKLELPDGSKSTALEYSFKLVNSIRTILGAQQIPASFIKLAETQSPEQALTACLNHTGLPSLNVAPDNFSPNFSGHASWYGGKFHGRRTSNGDRFDMHGLTAAHRTLPFGTKLLVMNRRTGATCVVHVNDRGPFVDDRVIDLSRGAAEKLNMLSSGVAMVDCMVINPADR
ncbi:septal ring lytic transglycosylase RlpA family protein [bacterium]|jgi:rare lipoprotein A|nr:septal ring lytic transglycosylase RlpA family protein [bacterium]